VTAWLICAAIAAFLGLATWGLAKATSREMPPYPQPEAPWEPDPSRFGRCPGCGTSRPVAGGVIAAHDYPEASVPFDQPSARCTGTGQLPMNSGDRRGSAPPTDHPALSPGEDSETVRRGNAAVEETGHLPPSMFARCGNHAERAKPPGKWLAADDFQDPAVPVDAGHDGCRTSEANHPPVGGAAGPGPVARPNREGVAPTGRDI
jgi:hypothetical protein